MGLYADARESHGQSLAPVHSRGDPVATPARALVLIAGTDLLLGPQSTGGHPSYVRAHALAARRLGYQPHIFAVTDGRSSSEEHELGVLHRVRTPVRPLRAHMAQLHSPFIARAITGFLAPRRGARSGLTAATGGQSQPYLLHGFGPWCLAGVLAASALRRRGVQAAAIASAYTTLQHESSGKMAGLRPRMGRAALEYPLTDAWVRLVATRAEGYAYRRARLVLVNYDTVRRLLIEAYGPGLEIQRVPYASALAFEANGAGDHGQATALDGLTAPESPLIVSVSRHDPRKGVDVLLEALAKLAREGVPFRACLIGPGPLLGANRVYAKRLGLGGRVAIPGRVEQVMPYLRAADVFVLPSLEEGSGSVSLLEALQAGVAVVASRLDGIPEDLIDGTDALLVDPGDPDALRHTLSSLLRDADARAALAARSHALYERRFSAAALTAALGEAYARAAASGSTAPSTSRTSSATRSISSSLSSGPEGR